MSIQSSHAERVAAWQRQLIESHGFKIPLLTVAKFLGTTRGAILTAKSAKRKTHKDVPLMQDPNGYWYSTASAIAEYLVKLEDRVAAIEPDEEQATEKILRKLAAKRTLKLDRATIEKL